MLLKNFVLLTLLLILTIFVLTGLFVGRSILDFSSVASVSLEKYADILSAGKYEDFPVSKAVGSKGFIAVVTEDGECVYHPDGAVGDLALTRDELALIPLYGGTTVVEESISGEGTDRANYQIHIRSTADSGEETSALYIFDRDYRLLYSSDDRMKEQLTEKEYLLLAEKYFGDYTVSRYAFTADSGQNLVLLLFEPADRLQAVIERVILAFIENLWLFVAAYCLFVFIFIRALRKTIVDPLELLHERMESYEVGNAVNEDYKGPRELREILESFSSLARRLNESEAQRQRLADAKQRMITDIAHDLKTPTTVVQGYARALDDGIIPQAEQKKYFQIIAQKANYLNELINTFYEYSKMEHPDYSLVLERSNICEYFRSYAAAKYNELDMCGFTIEADIPEERCFCMIDSVQLKRAFDNIIGNAMKHNAGGTTLFFRLRCSVDQVELILADDGCGIPADMAQDIFEPFVVGEQSRTRQGSGLGLSIARKIVEAHSGTIELMTEPPAPLVTAFRICLPTAATSCAGSCR
jgi:signal transduction histidine kinase